MAASSRQYLVSWARDGGTAGARSATAAIRASITERSVRDIPGLLEAQDASSIARVRDGSATDLPHQVAQLGQQELLEREPAAAGRATPPPPRTWSRAR